MSKRLRSKPNYKKRRREISSKYSKTPKGRISSIKNDSKRKHNLSRVSHIFTKEEFELKLNKTKGICQRCNKYFGLNKLEMDHIIPISKAKTGTGYTIDGIQFLCKSCNNKKGVKIE